MPLFALFPSGTGLLIGALAALLLIHLLLLPLVWRAGAVGAGRGLLGGLRVRLSAWLERVLGPVRLGFWQDQLQRADLPLRPGELYGLGLFMALLGVLLLNLVLGYVLLATCLGALLGLVPFLLVLRRANAHERAFLVLLQSTCTMLAGAAQTGAGPARLLELLAQAQSPLGAYFQAVVQAIPSKGTLLALADLAEHPHPRQLDAVLTAFQLHFAPGGGGPIAPLLQAAAQDIALSIRLSDTFRVRLERIRYQYWLVVALAGVVLVYLRLQEPDTVQAFLSSWLGQIYELALGVFAGLMGLAMQRLTRLPGTARAPRRSPTRQGGRP